MSIPEGCGFVDLENVSDDDENIITFDCFEISSDEEGDTTERGLLRQVSKNKVPVIRLHVKVHVSHDCSLELATEILENDKLLSERFTNEQLKELLTQRE